MLNERKGCLSVLSFLQKPLVLFRGQASSERVHMRETINGEAEDLLRDELREVLQSKYPQFEELYETAYELYYEFSETVGDELAGRARLQRKELFNKLLNEDQLPKSTVIATVDLLCYSSCAEIAKDSRFQARTITDGCQGLNKHGVYALIKDGLIQIQNMIEE